MPEGDPSAGEPRRGPANLLPSAGTTRDGAGAVSARKESLLSCWPGPAATLCLPEVLQVHPAGHKARTPRAQPGTADATWAVLLLPLPDLPLTLAASLQKYSLNSSACSTAVCLSSYFLLKVPDWFPKITKYCSHL